MSTATTGTSSSESQDWNSTATKVAKALANVISLTSNEKDQDPTATNNATIAQSNKCTKPPNNNSHEPTTELREGVEWVSFVYSHHRTLRRYCIRTDLDKVDISILDDKFKKENCVSIISIYFFSYYYNTPFFFFFTLFSSPFFFFFCWH